MAGASVDLAGVRLGSEGEACLVFPDGRKLCIDLSEKNKGYGKNLRGLRELLARACGLQRKDPVVIDATFGLGRDAWTLIRLGAEVWACEREPLLTELFQRAMALGPAALTSRLHLLNTRAEEFFLSSQGQALRERAPFVYLDPMFPESKKTALPGLEMQLFRSWLGADEEGAHCLFQQALDYAPFPEGRVVVKRPLKGPLLAEKPLHQLKGTSVRYDVYQGRGR